MVDFSSNRLMSGSRIPIPQRRPNREGEEQESVDPAAGQAEWERLMQQRIDAAGANVPQPNVKPMGEMGRQDIGRMLMAFGQGAAGGGDWSSALARGAAGLASYKSGLHDQDRQAARDAELRKQSLADELEKMRVQNALRDEDYRRSRADADADYMRSRGDRLADFDRQRSIQLEDRAYQEQMAKQQAEAKRAYEEQLARRDRQVEMGDAETKWRRGLVETLIKENPGITEDELARQLETAFRLQQMGMQQQSPVIPRLPSAGLPR